jgi:hypothetical protein
MKTGKVKLINIDNVEQEYEYVIIREQDGNTKILIKDFSQNPMHVYGECSQLSVENRKRMISALLTRTEPIVVYELIHKPNNRTKGWFW